MPQARSDIAAQEPGFYKQGYRKLIIILYLMMTIAYLLIGIIVYQHLTRPVPKYFVTTSDGSLVEINALPDR